MLLLACAGAATAQPDCAQAPQAAADSVNELLLLVDSGPGSEPALMSVLYGWGNRFWVDEATLGSWRVGVSAPGARNYGANPWHALEDIPGLAFEFDGCGQRLHVDLARVERATLRYELTQAERIPVPPANPGAYLNLDAQYSRDRSRGELASLAEIGAFGPYGRGVQTLLLGDHSLRLDTAWLWESPSSIATIALGDSIGNGGVWGRSLRFGGLRWATDFSLQPYVVTFPRPTLRGDAALPSTLDVFVNDTLNARQQVEGGAFELSEVPTLTGAGEAQIVIRDPLGRESRVIQPFYVSPALLKPGLRVFSLDAGWERERYATASFDYGRFFTDYTERRGITDTWTQEVRLETESHSTALGTSALWLPERIGLFSATAAWGRDGDGDGAGGALGALGFERDAGGLYSVTLRTQWTTPRFWQLGMLQGHRPVRREDLVRVSVVPHRRGSLALAIAEQDRRDEADLRLITLSYSAQVFPDLQFIVNAVDARADTHERSVLAAVSYRFGEQFDGGAQYEWNQHGEDAQRLGVQRPQRGPLDWGAGAQVQRGALDRQELRATWGLPDAQLYGEAVHEDQGSSARIGASTAVVFLDRKGYFSRPIQGSFAVVKVADVPDVNIYADQRLVARTGPTGTALVPDLRAYERNSLSIRPGDVPLDLPLPAMSQTVTPRTRSGVVVDFAGEARVGAQFIVRNPAGAPVPTGAVVREIALAEQFPVGADGRIYVTLPVGTHHLWVDAKGWDCIAEVSIARGDALLDARPVTCKPQHRR